MSAREVLVADGFRFVAEVPTTEADYDGQGHLNNASIARLFNDLRIAYVQGAVGSFWIDMLQAERIVVAAKELHVLYESEGFPGDHYVGAVRYVRWDGKAAILEQRILTRETARPVARAWVVQLVARDGRAIDWPPEYYDRVCEIEERIVERRPARRDRVFGPPQ